MEISDAIVTEYPEKENDCSGASLTNGAQNDTAKTGSDARAMMNKQENI